MVDDVPTVKTLEDLLKVPLASLPRSTVDRVVQRVTRDEDAYVEVAAFNSSI